jgi:hypothetical protein
MASYFPSAGLLMNGQSITGSFYKIQVMASGSVIGASAGAVAHFTALKDIRGNNIVPAGGMYIPAGTTVEFMVTSASLGNTSAPVLFFS